LVDAVDNDGNSGLGSAAFDGNAAIAEVLLRAGAKVDISDSDGCTPLMNAAKAGELDLVEGLIAAGANVNCRDHAGHTALTWAAIRGDFPAIVQLLVRHGADIDLAGGELGWTSLMCATRMRHIRTIEMLLSLGATRTLLGGTGDSALSIAAELGDEAIAKLLGTS
jgi:ankyrin repeat protein